MELEEKIKRLILTKYKSVRAFADAEGLPYTTVASMLHRGIMNARLETVFKVCKCLNISVDALEHGEICPRVKNIEDEELTTEESEMLAKYRQLDERGQRRIRRALETEYEDAVASSVEDSLSAVGNG